MRITNTLVADNKVIKINDIIIKKFNIMSDDFAYTKSNKFADALNRLSKEELIQKYPEISLKD